MRSSTAPGQAQTQILARHGPSNSRERTGSRSQLKKSLTIGVRLDEGRASSMSFQNIDEISEALSAQRVPVRELYAAWEQRQPVADPEKRKLSGKTSAKQIDWVQSDLSLALRFTECALKTDEFMLVCDAAREAIRHWMRQDDHDRTKLVRMR